NLQPFKKVDSMQEPQFPPLSEILPAPNSSGSSQPSDSQFSDWSLTPSPSGPLTTPSFSDWNLIPAPQADWTSKPFPEYATVDPSMFQDLFHNIGTAFDAGLWASKPTP